MVSPQTYYLSYAGISMGVLPPATSLAGLPTFAGPPTATTATSGPGSLADQPITTAMGGTHLTLATEPTGQIATTTAMAETAARLFPIPENICTKLKNLGFVDMADLKPSSWFLHTEEADMASYPFKKKEPVMDILVWVQCYSAMATGCPLPLKNATPDGLSEHHR